MKRRSITTALLGMFGVFAVFAASPAQANNVGVERALASYGDTSLFYAALLNSGVLNELDPNVNYTVFAPTNDAFASIQPRIYPCFYSTQCRAQVADVLRDHIVVGRRSLGDLTRETEVPTLGRYRVYVESPYVGEYAVADHKVLSEAELYGNEVYRIDGVIIANQQLAQFRTPPPVTNAVAQEETITTYLTSTAYPVPGGGYHPGATETVSEKTYAAPNAPPSTTVIYPDGTETTTTVTRSIATSP